MTRKNLAAFAVALVVASSGSGCAISGAPVSRGPGITGTYVVNGFDAAGYEYSGLVTITEGSSPDQVDLHWVITGAILEGSGTVRGDTLVVTWRTVEDPRGLSTGKAEYTIGEDGALDGTRTIDGVAGSGTEEIIPKP